MLIDTNITPKPKAKEKAPTASDIGAPVFYDTKEVAQLLGCSIPTAREIMQRPDFPLIMVGKNYKVYRDALIRWAMERRV